MDERRPDDFGSPEKELPGAPAPVVEEPEVLYCYGHPKTPTRLRCSRCDRPICGRCAIPASVGQHCPECVAEARRTTPKVKSVIRAKAPVVTALLAVNVAVFIAQQLSPSITERFASYPPLIAQGEWWRLLTPMFLHASGLHILLNMFVLWIYGPTAEEAFGSLRFAIIYVVCGFGGCVGSYAFGSFNAFSVGASGAIFGVVGLLVVYLYRRRSRQFVAGHLRSLGMFIVLNLALGLAIPRIDSWAHIGGLVTGALLGFGLDRGDSRVSAGVQVAVVAAVGLLGVAMVMLRTNTLLA